MFITLIKICYYSLQIYIFIANILIMKRIFAFVLFLVPVSIFAQLTVSSGSYLFVRDQLVFVAQDINLASGNIFLRQEGQLLQGTTGLSANRGIGALSLYQRGTVDNYEYNYWCSPVGNASAAPGNENFGITMLGRPATIITADPPVILPLGSPDGIAYPFSIAPYWINKFQAGATYSEWIPVHGATNIAAGEGFTMKGTSGTDVTPLDGEQNNPGGEQRYDFSGKPNDGNILINVANGQFTLTGNPYPSAIDLSAFLFNAVNSTGIAYFWEQDKTINSHAVAAYRGGYGTYAPIGAGPGIYVPASFYAYAPDGTPLGVQSTPMNSYARQFSPIGQGFLIEGNGAGTTVTMQNSYRVFVQENPMTSVFERPGNIESATSGSGFLPPIKSVSGFDYTTVSTAPVPQIQFNALMNNTGMRQFVVAFNPAATDGVDHAMDARMPSNNLPADAFISIGQSEYVISVIDFDVNKRLPLGLKNTATAQFKIAVSDIVNAPQVQNVYIYDKSTGIYHDIRNGIFEVTMPAGVNTERFEITFTNQALSSPEVAGNAFDILQNNVSQMLSIVNPDLINIQAVQLYDMTGKRIFDNQQIGGLPEYSIPTSGLSEGVYIVKVLSDKGSAIAQKISVFRMQ